MQLSDVTVNDVDKCHRIGPTDNDDKKNIIMESTKHSTATKVFRERRKLSKLISWKKYVKFHTSLMRQGQNLLTFARNLCAEAEEPIGNRQVYSFRNKMELVEILAKLDLDSYQLVDHDFDEF